MSLLAEDIVFNRTALVDKMWLGGEPVLHVVDKDTGFNAGVFLRDGEKNDAAWSSYLRMWVYACTGHPNVMHTDKGQQLTSEKWRALVQAVGTKHIESGIESHSALGSRERYHAFLRQILRRVWADHPTLAVYHALSLAVSAMSNAARPAGQVSLLFVFGIVLRTPINPVDLPEQRMRLKAIRTALDEMRRNGARARLRTALRTCVPRAADVDIAAGMTVLVFRKKPVNCWVGRYTIVKTDEKHVSLEVDGNAKLFAIDKIKRYQPSSLAGADGRGRKETPEDLSDVGAPVTQGEVDLSVLEVGDEELEQLIDAVRTGDQLLSGVCAGLHTFSQIEAATERTLSHVRSPHYGDAQGRRRAHLDGALPGR